MNTSNSTEPQNSNNPFNNPTTSTNEVVCAASFCHAGHMWRPQLALTRCTGCANDVLALRMVLCPACNEPAIRHELRVDHIAHGMKAGVASCRGEKCEGEVINVQLQHSKHHADRVDHNDLIREGGSV